MRPPRGPASTPRSCSASCPGFAYLGLLPEALESPRRATPRVRVPAGSVAVAGRQTGIYPVASPGRLAAHRADLAAPLRSLPRGARPLRPRRPRALRPGGGAAAARARVGASRSPGHAGRRGARARPADDGAGRRPRGTSPGRGERRRADGRARPRRGQPRGRQPGGRRGARVHDDGTGPRLPRAAALRRGRGRPGRGARAGRPRRVARPAGSARPRSARQRPALHGPALRAAAPTSPSRAGSTCPPSSARARRTCSRASAASRAGRSPPATASRVSAAAGEERPRASRRAERHATSAAVRVVLGPAGRPLRRGDDRALPRGALARERDVRPRRAAGSRASRSATPGPRRSCPTAWCPARSRCRPTAGRSS